MSWICDMCRKPLKEDTTFFHVGEKDICNDCVEICREIMKDKNTSKVTYLNEYKEKKEMDKSL
jgi:hypothetical protein